MLAARRKGGRRSMSPSESDETCPSTCWEAGFVVIHSVTSGSPAMSGPERASHSGERPTTPQDQRPTQREPEKVTLSGFPLALPLMVPRTLLPEKLPETRQLVLRPEPPPPALKLLPLTVPENPH